MAEIAGDVGSPPEGSDKQLRNPEKTAFSLARVSQIIAVVAAAAGVLLSMAGFMRAALSDAETHRLAARQPFLNRQLALYVEAVQIGGKLATRAAGSSEVGQARQRFLELYYGELSLVEDRAVEAAMVKIKRTCMEPGAECSQQTLGELVLRLTEACRRSLATSWGVSDWIERRSDAAKPDE